jgi:hypothetical protein
MLSDHLQDLFGLNRIRIVLDGHGMRVLVFIKTSRYHTDRRGHPLHHLGPVLTGQLGVYMNQDINSFHTKHSFKCLSNTQ